MTGFGIDCGTGRVDCDEVYAPDTLVALTAVPAAGYVFLGWVGDCVGEESAAVVINRRRFCTPVFSPAPGSGLPQSPDHSDGVFFIQGMARDIIAMPVDFRARLVYPELPANSPGRSTITPALGYPTSAPDVVRFTVAGPGRVWFDVAFGAPTGSVLVPGDYLYTSSSPAQPSTVPMLSISGQRSLCNQGGRFRLHEYVVDNDTGAVTAFAADFECAPDIAGSIRYRSSLNALLPFDSDYPLRALHIVPTVGGYVTGDGISCGDGGRDDCDEAYGSSAAVPVDAVASPGYEFLAWTGHCTGGSTTTSLNVDGAKRCFAVFGPTLGGAPDNPLFASATLYVETLGTSTSPNRSIWLGEEARVAAFGSSSSVHLTFTSPASGSTIAVGFGTGGEPLGIGEFEQEFYGSSGFSISGCGGSVARFVIHEMSIGSGGTLLSFAADFEALCTFAPDQRRLIGAVRFNSTRARIIPFDGRFPLSKLTIEPAINGIVTGAGIDCGPGRSACTVTAEMPFSLQLQAAPLPGFRFVGWSGACDGASITSIAVNWIHRCSAIFNAVVPGIGVEDARLRDNAFMIDSQSGDPVGRARRHIWLDARMTSLQEDQSRVTLVIQGSDGASWNVYLKAPVGEQLRAGSYEGAVAIFQATSSPGILVGSTSGSCTNSGFVGRFVIYEISFASSTSRALTALAADFEQQCEPEGPRLRGAIRFQSSRSVLTPFAPSTFTPVHPPVRGDFNRDGSPDLVWR
ncbi:MAG: hypothetical protein WBC51_21515, partial [Vicinamibacterales bacterium]